MNQKVDLVTDNYYEKTLVYQDKIDEAERSKLYDNAIKLEYLNNQLTINVSDSLLLAMKNGELYFYRPSDSGKDFKMPIDFNGSSNMMFDVSKVERGYWKVHINWLMNNQSYSLERSVMIN
jgi:nitrogen fixation protein FixH